MNHLVHQKNQNPATPIDVVMAAVNALVMGRLSENYKELLINGTVLEMAIIQWVHRAAVSDRGELWSHVTGLLPEYKASRPSEVPSHRRAEFFFHLITQIRLTPLTKEAA